MKIANQKRPAHLRSRQAAHSIILRKLTRHNPRRQGTHGHTSFALIRSGMTYEDYVARGGRNRDLAWDVERGYVALEKKGRK